MKCDGREQARLSGDLCFSCNLSSNYLMTLNKSLLLKIEFFLRAVVISGKGGERSTKGLFQTPAPAPTKAAGRN